MNTLLDHFSKLGMTQAELAERLGVRPPTVSDWLRGVKRPKPCRVPDLARELRVSPERLFTLLYQPKRTGR